MVFDEYDEITYMEPGTPVPYKLEFYYRQSINEIRGMIEHHMYHDTSTISEHLLFLEHLADKLQQVLANERSAGESAMMLRKQLADIKNLYDTLNSIMQRMKNAS